MSWVVIELNKNAIWYKKCFWPQCESLEQINKNGGDNMKKDCLNCGNSLSDDDNNLYCSVHQKIVDEDEKCDEYN
ncbi:hypothetical protein FOS03_25975 [Bacillus paranthracis]|nr:hypothetical protein [Bacillus paranthracis]